MNTYNQNLTTGELWLRTLDGTKQPASVSLSGIYLKYASVYPTFYNELTSNQIRRFDTFEDCIFIETQSGYIFEKVSLEDNSYKPFNTTNLYTPIYYKQTGSLVYGTSTDYWYDANSKKVYYAYILSLDENKNFSDRFSFVLIVNLFDCKTGSLQTVLFHRISLAFSSARNWSPFNAYIESPKITRNSDTGRYNISFLLKNETKEFGLISINLAESHSVYYDKYKVEEINSYLPYLAIDENRLEEGAYDPNIVQPYRVLTVSSFLNKQDPAYRLRFIRVFPEISVYDSLNLENYEEITYLAIE
jgi:hypothetical protein